jgi:hypothetical protein
VRNDAFIRPARTCECHTSILGSPTDEGHGEQEPATKGAIVGGGTDGGEYGCHDRKADAIRNKDDTRDGFGTTHPREDTLSRGRTGKTGRTWSNGWIVASGSSEALEQGLGITERTDTLWEGMGMKNETRWNKSLRCRRYSRLSSGR